MIIHFFALIRVSGLVRVFGAVLGLSTVTACSMPVACTMQTQPREQLQSLIMSHNLKKPTTTGFWEASPTDEMLTELLGDEKKSLFIERMEYADILSLDGPIAFVRGSMTPESSSQQALFVADTRTGEIGIFLQEDERIHHYGGLTKRNDLPDAVSSTVMSWYQKMPQSSQGIVSSDLNLSN